MKGVKGATRPRGELGVFRLDFLYYQVYTLVVNYN